ncbi:uncharacterized protein EV422DRAFT_559109 [Fimicolochytrium jonesii]|uniref:uncharacterized protein n=1 Tax=Fimicolochytrium jonesii TaxID=1396493 RepID=UPI0022FDD027|nr:uncharacterized protein EV422DRAFT_559109 [Fimicolochytrium jonesii]KAI8818936.1 hypothetical protein EV422DRAFT_559109 [Fimicolochytrium jonesii]
MNSLKRHVADLRFTNSFTRDLVKDARTPGEPFVRPTVRNPLSSAPRQVPNAHFSYVQPETTPDPVLLSVSEPCAQLLDLDVPGILKDPEAKKEFLGFVSGNELPKTTNSWSMCYGGHQFGVWASQLGDGRAITLGEIANSRNEKWELQLKGAGMTPYSRFADGYAVLRSSIREYLCSEAMHHLGVPTTRALSLVGSTRLVQREKEETGAVVLRLAPTWVRFGNFEIFIARGDVENMKRLADWVIKNHYPECDALTNTKYSQWLREVVRRTAIMIAGWQSVGFCHGVMNTDNMSILGLTLDYGPFQFLDKYDAEYICNHSDNGGRYSFDNQPGIGLWNLTRLASSVSPLIVEEVGGGKEDAEKLLREILADYSVHFHTRYRELMGKKLGFLENREDDLEKIVTPLMEVLGKENPDHTKFFRQLSTDFALAPSSTQPPLASPLESWYALYRARLLSELPIPSDDAALAKADKERVARMKAANPKYILRNHLAQRVIEEAEAGKFEGVNELLSVLQRPFEDGTPEEEKKWAGEVPGWAEMLKCSCSS